VVGPQRVWQKHGGTSAGRKNTLFPMTAEADLAAS